MALQHTGYSMHVHRSLTSAKTPHWELHMLQQIYLILNTASEFTKAEGWVVFKSFIVEAVLLPHGIINHTKPASQ